MNILCLMGLFPENYEAGILNCSISGVQNAANKLQWAIVEGLCAQTDVRLDIVNSLFIGAYPKRYKKARIPSFSFAVEGNEIGRNVGFLNLPLIKYFSKYNGMKKAVDAWVANHADEENAVVAYAMTSPMVELLRYVKNKYPKIKCILFVPDLPEYMDVTNKSLGYSILKKHHIAHLKKNIAEIDGYVFLTDHMKEWFDKDVAYTVIEGICKDSPEIPCGVAEKEKVVLYAGGLCEEYGILDLVESFMKINDREWKLELIGDGPLLPELKRLQAKDGRLVIRGIQPNSEVLKRQKQVSVLVNPRKSGQTFTKYSFPSKTIEYMASGTPMIGYLLPGIPAEYYRYIYAVEQTENGLENCLKKVMALSPQERDRFGFSAQQFIRNEKNAEKQCTKMMKLIEAIRGSDK